MNKEIMDLKMDDDELDQVAGGNKHFQPTEDQMASLDEFYKTGMSINLFTEEDVQNMKKHRISVQLAFADKITKKLGDIAGRRTDKLLK